METVKIKHDSHRGWRIINKSDFDESKHQLFDSAPEKQTKPATKKTTKAPQV